MRTPIHSVSAKRDFAAQMRRAPTAAEATLWYYLKGKQIGFVFHRQSLQRGYILDFYCPKLKLAIEVDGSVHNLARQAEEDARKEEALTNWGIKILRFTNQDVLDFSSVVMARIKTTLKALSSLHSLGANETSTLVVHSRPCGSLQNSESSHRDEWKGLKAVLSQNAHLWRPKEIPEDQRITREDAEQMVGACKKLLTCDKQRSIAFVENTQTMAERAFDQKYRLEQWLKKRNGTAATALCATEPETLTVAKGMHVAEPLARKA